MNKPNFPPPQEVDTTQDEAVGAFYRYKDAHYVHAVADDPTVH